MLWIFDRYYYDNEKQCKNQDLSHHVIIISFQLSPTEDGCGFKVIELMDKLEESEQRIRQLELNLAQTKLELVEAQCKNQDLSHQVIIIIFLYIVTSGKIKKLLPWYSIIVATNRNRISYLF